MAFKIKSFKELVTLTKEKLDEQMVPLRIRSAKAKAESEKIKLEEKLISLETKIHEGCATKDINFVSVADLMDEYDLTERRLNQINNLVAQLFPEA